ncbi:acetylxylan esterase [Streptomyces sp. NPDC048290]|uniref:acetylxylan esterase n=1 Tax=Streptomyces sp. NPDC048290 TaxID=3155811 RepID=UPI0034386D82
MSALVHDFPFDPAYGFTLPELLDVAPPPAPDDFDAFWRDRWDAAARVTPEPWVGPLVEERTDGRVYEVSYASASGRCGGWLVLPPEGEPVRHGFVIGHGYGGRDGVGDALPLPLPGSAALLPCVTGMPVRGLRAEVPSSAERHVLHGIGDRDSYVIGECVADLWGAASALTELAPGLAGRGRLGYLGESFGGGLGALALPWDERFGAAALTVPTFGHHPLRVTLPCVGSGEAVRGVLRAGSGDVAARVMGVLGYFDAAVAAGRVGVPVLCAPALFDPAVPPPGQFAVFNGLGGERELFVLSAGHFGFAGEAEERGRLAGVVEAFFGRWLGARG